MIVEAIMNMLRSVFFSLFDFVNIPALSDTVVSYVYDFISLLDYATSFIGFFVPRRAWTLLFPIWSGMFVINHLYPLIMWIIRKIPLSID